MRFLVVACVLASTSALAQPEPPRSLNAGQTVLIFYGGYGGGLIGAATAGVLLNKLGASSGVSIVTAIVVYPLTTATATYGIGQAFGGDGSFQSTLVGATLGAGAGLGVSLIVSRLVGPDDEGPPEDAGDLVDAFSDALAAGFAIVVPYVLGPPIGAMVGFSLSAKTSAIVSPDGSVAPGLSLRVGL